jgi:hypothetical protein
VATSVKLHPEYLLAAFSTAMENPDMSKSSISIVASMHRSGSSLTASLLQSAGLHIGRRLMEPAPGNNDKGFFENLDFFEFHMEILRSQGVNQDGWTLQEKMEVEDRFVDLAKELVARNSLSAHWGWKDPRTTLFLDFWAELLPEANFFLIYRSPWEVVDSLYRRGDSWFQDKPELAVKMWLHYNQKILNFYNRFSGRCLLVNLSTIVNHHQSFIEVANQKFQTNLVAPELSIYDPSSIHTQGSDSHRPTLLDRNFPEAIQMYQELDARAWQPDGVPNFQWRESIESSLYRFWPFQDWRNIRALEKENKHLQTVLEESQSQLQQTQTELEQTQNQLLQTEGVLGQSQSQLQQTQTELEQSLTQLQQTQTELEQTQNQLLQTEGVLEQSQSQLQQTEEVLEQYHIQLKQMEKLGERSRLQQTLTSDPTRQKYAQYELLTWDAFHAYQEGDSGKMQECLELSLRWSPFLRTENPVKWLEKFQELSSEGEIPIDTSTLTNTTEWKQLIQRVMAAKGDRIGSSNSTPEFRWQ